MKPSYLAAGLAALIATSGITVNHQINKKESLENLNQTLSQIEVTVPNAFEYGSASINPMKYIQKLDNINVEVSQPEIKTQKVGKIPVTYRFETRDKYNQVANREIEATFVIEDTQSPEIELKQEGITVTQGIAYDPAENVESVNDSVIGELKLSDPNEVGYWVETDYEDTPGNYTVTVHAQDDNGNETEVDYPLVVKAKPVAQAVAAQPQAASNQSSVSAPQDSGWWAMGSAGAIKIGGYQAALEWRDFYSNIQGVIDTPGVAAYAYTGAGAEYIADHNGQGMEQAFSNNSLQIKRPDGSVETLYKSGAHFSSAGVNSNWYSDDGFDNWYSADGRLVTQVCGGGGIWWIYWS